MIKIISGTCRTELGLKNSSDQPFSLSKEAEERLVNRKVAVYVTQKAVATPPVKQEQNGTGVNSGKEENGAKGAQGGGEEKEGENALTIVDGHYVKEELMKLTRPELNDMAENLGLDGAPCNNKGEVADLIVSIEVAAEEDDEEESGQMPNLNPEDPVV